MRDQHIRVVRISTGARSAADFQSLVAVHQQSTLTRSPQDFEKDLLWCSAPREKTDTIVPDFFTRIVPGKLDRATPASIVAKHNARANESKEAQRKEIGAQKCREYRFRHSKRRQDRYLMAFS
jgi:hypothetical protein